MNKLDFILFYSMFLFFIVQIGSMAGINIVKNAPAPPSLPPKPTVLDYLVYPFQNIGYFFSLMRVSSDYLLFGSLILVPYIITLIWIIIELVRGV